MLNMFPLINHIFLQVQYLDTHKYNTVLTSLLETFLYLQDGLSSDDALVSKLAFSFF